MIETANNGAIANGSPEKSVTGRYAIRAGLRINRRQLISSLQWPFTKYGGAFRDARTLEHDL